MLNLNQWKIAPKNTNICQSRFKETLNFLPQALKNIKSGNILTVDCAYEKERKCLIGVNLVLLAKFAENFSTSTLDTQRQ